MRAVIASIVLLALATHAFATEGESASSSQATQPKTSYKPRTLSDESRWRLFAVQAVKLLAPSDAPSSPTTPLAEPDLNNLTANQVAQLKKIGEHLKLSESGQVVVMLDAAMLKDIVDVYLAPAASTEQFAGFVEKLQKRFEKTFPLSEIPSREIIVGVDPDSIPKLHDASDSDLPNEESSSSAAQKPQPKKRSELISQKLRRVGKALTQPFRKAPTGSSQSTQAKTSTATQTTAKSEDESEAKNENDAAHQSEDEAQAEAETEAAAQNTAETVVETPAEKEDGADNASQDAQLSGPTDTKATKARSKRAGVLASLAAKMTPKSKTAKTAPTVAGDQKASRSAAKKSGKNGKKTQEIAFGAARDKKEATKQATTKTSAEHGAGKKDRKQGTETIVGSIEDAASSALGAIRNLFSDKKSDGNGTPAKAADKAKSVRKVASTRTNTKAISAKETAKADESSQGATK